MECNTTHTRVAFRPTGPYLSFLPPHQTTHSSNAAYSDQSHRICTTTSNRSAHARGRRRRVSLHQSTCAKFTIANGDPRCSLVGAMRVLFSNKPLLRSTRRQSRTFKQQMGTKIGVLSLCCGSRLGPVGSIAGGQRPRAESREPRAKHFSPHYAHHNKSVQTTLWPCGFQHSTNTGWLLVVASSLPAQAPADAERGTVGCKCCSFLDYPCRRWS